jgi:alkylation response protein AidB-like acyl-CoA dehydrogenase
MPLQPTEYEKLRKSIFDFIWRELDPLEEQISKTGHIPQEELFPKFREQRLFGLMVPAEYGGVGLSVTQYLPILSELAKISGGIRVILHVHNMAAKCMTTGREEQKRAYLPRIATGDLSVAFGLTEPDAGTGTDIKTTAVRDGDSFILNGEKHLITNADFTKLFMIFCYTNRNLGVKGISTLLVERDTPGFSIEDMPHCMGCWGSFHGRLTFQDCRVPVTNILGKEGSGLDQSLGGLEVSRVFIAATSLGTSERCLELALQHAKRRVTFGKPIADRQAVQGYLADMAMDIYALRAMIYDAARKYDEGGRIPFESSACKLFGSEVVCRVTDKALLVFGGIGYTQQYPIERLYRDARLNVLEEGTPTIQRLVMARTLLQG